MAYRLRRQETIAQGLRRLARKELRAAHGELRRANPPREEAIHEGRKSVKKARAIVQLIDADGGSGLAGSRKRLGRVNRILSRLRDADAMIEILTKLRDHDARLFSEHTFARVRRRLLSNKRSAMEAAGRDGAWKKVDRQLRKLRRAAKRWRPAHRRFGALAPGIRAAHRRGRKAMARAQKTQRAADFHDWRKQMKTLWYQLRLLEECGPAIRRDVAALHRAESELGDDHNVVVLCAELWKDSSVCGGPLALSRLRQSADRYQCELRRKAVASVQRIYARTSGDCVRGVKRAWKGWQKRGGTRRAERPRRAAV